MTNEEKSAKAADVLTKSIQKVHEKDRTTTDLIMSITTTLSAFGIGMVVEYLLHGKHWNKEMDKAKKELESMITEDTEENANEQTE